jgi:tetratricopeptide (TPR) repeat protein
MSGRAGMGKTHLAQRFLDQLPRKTTRLRGRGLQAGVPPLFPIGDALRSHKRGIQRDQFTTALAELSQSMPLFREYVGGLTRARRRTRYGRSDVHEALPTETRIFFELTALIQKLESKEPLVLFLDDIQWSDASTLAFLGYFITQLREHRVFLLLIRRVNGYNSDELDRLLRAMSRELGEASCELYLGGLDRGEQRALIEAELGAVELDEAELDWLERSSEANPFYLRELIGDLRQRGMLAQQGGVWRFVGELGPPRSPPSLKGYRLERIDRASRAWPGARELIHLAACAGTSFDARLLAAALDQRIMVIHEALAKIEEHSGLVHRVEDTTTYCFDHDLTRESVLKELGSFAHDLHIKIARTMIESEQGVASLVAHQFEAALERAEASHWYLEAARDASRQGLFEAARDYARRADSLLDELGVAVSDPRRAESTSALSQALFGAERYGEVIALLDERSELLEGSQAGPLLHVLGRAEARMPDKELHERAVRHLREALRYASEESLYATRANILADLVNAYDASGDFSASKNAYKQGLEQAARSGDLSTNSRYKRLACVFWQPDKVGEGLVRFIPLLRARELEYEIALCENNLGSAYFGQGELAAAREHYAESDRLLGKLGGYRRDTPVNNLGLVTLFEGDPAGARERLLEAKRISRDEHSKLFIESNLGALDGLTHNFDRSLDWLEPLVERAEATGDLFFEDCIRHNFAYALLESGQCERALEVLVAVEPHHSHPEELLVLAKRAALEVRLLECLARPVDPKLREQARHLEVSTKPQVWLYRMPWYFCDIEFWED